MSTIYSLPETVLQERNIRHFKTLVETMREADPAKAVRHLGSTIEATTGRLQLEIIDFTLPIVYEEKGAQRVSSYDLVTATNKVIRNTVLPSEEKDCAVDIDLMLLDDPLSQVALEAAIRLKVARNLFKHCSTQDRRVSTGNVILNLLDEPDAATALLAGDRLLGAWETALNVKPNTEDGQAAVRMLLKVLKSDTEQLPLPVKVSAIHFVDSVIQPGTDQQREATALRDELTQLSLQNILATASFPNTSYRPAPGC